MLTELIGFGIGSRCFVMMGRNIRILTDEYLYFGFENMSFVRKQIRKTLLSDRIGDTLANVFKCPFCIDTFVKNL